MAKPRYEYCEVADIRRCVEERLLKLPACKIKEETPSEFWGRVERAGLLLEALSLYDEIAAARKQASRETKEAFDQRLEREGRRDEAERVRAELLASGLTQRQAQAKLVELFQPQDGTMTMAWQTPDSWEQGRLFKKKADQQQLLTEISNSDKDDEEDEEDEGMIEAENKLHWAELRRDERQALREARRGAWALKTTREKLPRSAKRAARSRASAAGHQRKNAASADDRVEI